MTEPFILLAFLLCSAAPARAAVVPAAITPSSGRAIIEVGPWGGTFQQTGYGHTANVGLKAAVGIQAKLGATFSDVMFVEWAPYWHTPTDLIPDNDYSDDAAFYSLTSFNLGFYFTGLKIAAYVGADITRLGFLHGTGAAFEGNSLRVGVTLPFTREKTGLGIGATAQYSKFFPSKSDFLPEGIGATGTFWFVGLSVGKL